MRTKSLLCIGITLYALVRPLSGAEDVIRVGFFPNVTHAQALVARNMSREGKGWFESRLGVRIDWYVFNAGPSAMESIFAKSVDMTYVGPSPAINAYARSAGEEVRVLSGAMRGGTALVVKGDEIQDVANLRGKIIATPQLGNTQDVECRAWLIEHGLKVTLTGGDVKVLPVANPEIMTLFQQGRINGAWTVEPWVSRLLKEFEGRIFHQDDETVTTILVARTAYLAGNPDLVRRFTAAHRELTEWVKANPEEAQRRVRDELTAITRRELSIELIQESWKRLIFENAITIEPFEKFLKQAREANLLRVKVDLSQLLSIQP